MEEQSRGAPLDEQRLQDFWLPQGQGRGESCSPQPWGGHGGAGGPRQATALWVQQLRASFVLAQPQKNTSQSGHHFPGASRQERERRAGGCERGTMPAQPGAASCQQPPAVPTISVLCGTCEKALPFLSHAAAAAAAGPLGPEWTEPHGHRRGSQMCAGWLGVYWHTVRLIRIGPGWHCSIN